MLDLFQVAVSLHQAGRIDEAGALYRRVIAESGGHAHASYLLGNLLLDRNEPFEARRHLIGAVKRDASNPHYHTALGLAFERLGDKEMAESSFRMATSLNRRYAEAWLQLGRMLACGGRLNEARIAYETLLDVEPGNERSLLALIEVVRHQGGADVLVSRIEAAEAAGLRRPAALRMRCAAFDITHEHERALQAALEWQALQPGVHEPIFAEGSALLGLGRTQEALQRLLRAHDLEPGHIETIVNTAHALHKLERYAEACRYYQIALRAEPSRTPALHGLSYALFKTAGKKRPDNLRLALRATRELMRRTSEGPITHAAIGAIFFAQLRVRDGLRHFRRSAELDGAATATLSSLLFHSNYSDEISCQEHYELHLQWAAKRRAELGPQFTAFKHSRDPGRRLRVGFVTADMCFHPVGYFLLPIVRGLANDFDLRLYSALAQGSEDEFTARFRDRVGDGFKRIAGLSDAEAAEIIRRDEVDVLFDLSGHTTGHRLGVFARRAAPVQVSWLGYPNTTGLASMDFRLSDPVTEPEGEADRYSSERIVRLPAGFHNYQPFYRFPDVGPLPALKNGWVTLGCFNNMRKVSPRTLGLWARVMKKLPSSRLLLKDRTLDYPENRERVFSLFAAHGINPSRISIKGMIDTNAAHLSTYSDVDIALDAYPYNGTTTTCEALFMGCPVVTLRGDRHVARVTASLLTHAGHPEWIADDEDAYVQLAARLGSDPAALARIRARLRGDLGQSPLCDTNRFVSDFATAIRWMWREHCAGRSGPSTSPSALEPAQSSLT